MSASVRVDQVHQHLTEPNTTMSAESNSFPLAKGTGDGYSNEEKASATCFCGGVQMEFPLKKPGLVDTFQCHCADCHVFTASAFASNFIAQDEHTKFNRGEDLLKEFSQNKTIESGNTMTNHFCSTCGTLMFRTGSAFKGIRIMRVGTVDDFKLQSTVLRPRIEQYTKQRLAWIHASDGSQEVQGSHYK